MSPEIHPVLVIHGPNLNMLGSRQPDIYGGTTLQEINDRLKELGRGWGLVVETFQSNHEGAIIDKIQAAASSVKGLIINPAAYTHTSIGIRDALLMMESPIIEIHLSNIHKREPFRHLSYVSDIATAQIMGLGAEGYFLALQALAKLLGASGC